MPPGLLTSQSPAPDTSWSSSEDAHLLFLISSMGPKQWLHIASLLPPHTPAQCRARYRLIRPPSSSPSPTSRSRSSSLPGKDGGRDKSSPLQSLGVLLTRSHPSSPSARWRTEGQLERDEAAVRGGRPKGYGMESLPIALRFVVFGDPPLRAAALGRWDWPLALLLTAVASTAGVSLLAHAHPHSVAALAALVQAATEPSSASLSAPSTSSPYHRALVSQSLCLLSPPLRLLTALLGSGVALLVLSSSYLLTVLAFVFLSRRAPSSSASVKPASSTPLLPPRPHPLPHRRRRPRWCTRGRCGCRGCW